MTYLAIGSALYHATSTRWAGMLDVTGIYTVFTAIAVYALVTLLLGDWPYTPMVMFIVAGLSATILSRVGRRRTPPAEGRRRGDRMRTVIALSLGTSYVCVLARMAITRDWSDLSFLVGSLLVFGLAYLSWGLDRKRTFPITPWGHGVWHVLTAAASALVFYAVDATISRPGAG